MTCTTMSQSMTVEDTVDGAYWRVVDIILCAEDYSGWLLLRKEHRGCRDEAFP